MLPAIKSPKASFSPHRSLYKKASLPSFSSHLLTLEPTLSPTKLVPKKPIHLHREAIRKRHM